MAVAGRREMLAARRLESKCFGKVPVTQTPLEKDVANPSAVNSPILKKIHENT